MALVSINGACGAAGLRTHAVPAPTSPPRWHTGLTSRASACCSV